MPSEDIRVDDAQWEAASIARRREWTTLLSDIPIHEIFPGHACRAIVIRCDEAAFGFALYLSDGAAERLELPRSALHDVLSEYLSVISRLEDDGLTAARAEALDMAKRVVHDDAARRLATTLPAIGAALRANRKVFSLLVALTTDTTQMSSAHRHL